MEAMPLQQVFDPGALVFFGERDTDLVKGYKIGGTRCRSVAANMCRYTGSMGRFRITKAEPIGQSVQRVRSDLVEARKQRSSNRSLLSV